MATWRDFRGPVTHYADWDAPGRQTVAALCGASIRRTDHTNTPTCHVCKRIVDWRARDPDPSIVTETYSHTGAAPMPNFNTAFPSRYLSASSLEQPYEATIVKVGIENVAPPDSKPENKLVARFDNDQAIVLNKTRCEALAELTRTPDYAKWPGTKVKISKGVTMFAGKRVDCIVLGESELPF